MISAEKFMLKHLYSTNFNKKEEAANEDKSTDKAKRKHSSSFKKERLPISISNSDISSALSSQSDAINLLRKILSLELNNAFNFHYPIECDVESHKVTYTLFGTEKPDTRAICVFHLFFDAENESAVKTDIKYFLNDYGWTISGNGFDEPYKLTGNLNFL